MSSETVSDERLADIAEILSIIVKQGDCRIFDAESKVPLPFKFDILLRAITELQSLRSKPVANGLDIADTCDGVEQTAFEEWASSEKYDMHKHPMHYLFLDPKTDAARMGWKAGIRHARNRITSALLPKATAPVVSEPVTEGMKAEALRLLKAYDEREDKVQEIIEDLREIVLLMPAASRPDGLMKQAQAAVYAMRGRTRLMDDVAITAPLSAETQPITVTDSMVERAWTAYDAKSGYSKPERFRAALEAAMKEASNG